MADNQNKPACKYGNKCYRQNEEHKSRFSHPSDNGDNENRTQISKRDRSDSPDPKQMEKKLKLNSSNSDNDSSDCSANDEEEVASNETDGGELKHETKLEDTNASSPHQPIESASTTDDVATENKNEVKTDTSTRSTAPENETFASKFIKSNFLVCMPNEFYKFWEFCENESKSNAPELLFSKLGLRLVGPFDVLANKFNKPFEKNEYLRHWRFFYDPPEFQTVMVKEVTGIHYGYWRDEPNGECFIARNNADDGYEFKLVADNLFEAVLYYLDKDIKLSPFTRSSALALKKSLETYAAKENIPLTSLTSSFSPKLKARNSTVVTKAFHRAGIVVPFDRKTDVGYRSLGESDAKLKKILKKFDDANGDKGMIVAAWDELQPLITAAYIACDESDFGNAIELGIDLFCFGSPELHSVALKLLSTGYELVKRPEYVEIIRAHLEDRRKGCSELSILRKKSTQWTE